jgi:hypothetical protein
MHAAHPQPHPHPTTASRLPACLQELEARFAALLGARQPSAGAPGGPAPASPGGAPLPSSTSPPAAAAAAAPPPRAAGRVFGLGSGPSSRGPGGLLLGSSSPAGGPPVSRQTHAFVAALAAGQPLAGLDDVPAAAAGAGGDGDVAPAWGAGVRASSGSGLRGSRAAGGSGAAQTGPTAAVFGATVPPSPTVASDYLDFEGAAAQAAEAAMMAGVPPVAGQQEQGRGQICQERATPAPWQQRPGEPPAAAAAAPSGGQPQATAQGGGGEEPSPAQRQQHSRAGAAAAAACGLHHAGMATGEAVGLAEVAADPAAVVDSDSAVVAGPAAAGSGASAGAGQAAPGGGPPAAWLGPLADADREASSELAGSKGSGGPSRTAGPLDMQGKATGLGAGARGVFEAIRHAVAAAAPLDPARRPAGAALSSSSPPAADTAKPAAAAAGNVYGLHVSPWKMPAAGGAGSHPAGPSAEEAGRKAAASPLSPNAFGVMPTFGAGAAAEVGGAAATGRGGEGGRRARRSLGFGGGGEDDAAAGARPPPEAPEKGAAGACLGRCLQQVRATKAGSGIVRTYCRSPADQVVPGWACSSVRPAAAAGAQSRPFS